MRILVGWDQADEADLISLYLGVDENQVTVATDPVRLFEIAQEHQNWDVILLSTCLPDADGAFDVFSRLRDSHPDCPIVGACQTQDVYRIVRFMTNGMRSYVLRDSGGDFVFLLHSTLAGAVEGVRAERERKLAERLREEIDSVRKLQESIIPRDLRNPLGYHVCARYEPSQIRVIGGQPVVMAGGDYYDVFTLDDRHTVVLVGDASGHGMKACMSIMTMHTLIRMIRGDGYKDTASFVKAVNSRLCDQSIVQDDGGFITVLYGILRTDTHEFQWTSAGHPVPLFQDLETGEVRPLAGNDASGLPLGIYDDAEYETHSFQIPERCRLLLYTDGLVEAFPNTGNGQHAEYGMTGIVNTLGRARGFSLEEALQALFEDSNAQTQGSGRHDDTSVVLLGRD